MGFNSAFKGLSISIAVKNFPFHKTLVKRVEFQPYSPFDYIINANHTQSHVHFNISFERLSTKNRGCGVKCDHTKNINKLEMSVYPVAKFSIYSYN